MTRARDDAGWEYLAALCPLDLRFVVDAKTRHMIKRGRPILMKYADEWQQKLFYESLLELPWLAPKVRYAAMEALGRSKRKEDTKIGQALTTMMRGEVAEAEARLQKNDARASRGSTLRDDAIDEVAARYGLTPEALKKRFVRL